MSEQAGRYEIWTGADGKVAGRIRIDAQGRRTFVIRRSVAGTRYEIATGKATLDEARVELAVFLRNAAAYVNERKAKAAPPPEPTPEPQPGAEPEGGLEPIYLDEKLVESFLAWSRRPKKDGGRGNTARWVNEQKLYLAWWSEKLYGIDLRRASFRDHIRPALEGAKSYRPRVAVILALYRWLRLERDLPMSEDPVHGRFYLPDSEPEQMRRNKAVPLERFATVLGHIVGVHRDLLLLQGDTGMHVSEAWRFAKEGAVEPLPVNATMDGSAGIIVIPWHKSSARGGKESLRIRVNANALAAAERILKHGAFSERRYTKAVKAACRAAGLAEDAVFGPGQMRHSVATHAINAGEDPAAVSAQFGHRSPKTVRKFYSVYAAPRKVSGTLSDGVATNPPPKAEGGSQ